MKIAICDDEKNYIDKILRLTNNYFVSKKMKIVTETFLDAGDFLQKDLQGYDIVFLDVDMGEHNGIDVAKQLRMKNKKAIVIYISALIEYAISGYSVHAFQYLLKNDLDVTFNECLDEVMRQLPLRIESVFIPTDAGGVKVPLRDIIFFESDNHNVKVHTQNQKSGIFTYRSKLSEIESNLLSKGFLRIQKSFLVNMIHIKTIRSRVVSLDTGHQLNCSKQNYQEILREYMLWEGRL